MTHPSTEKPKVEYLVLRAWFVQKRVVLEERERFLNREVMLGAGGLACPLVVADSSEVAEQQARRDRPWFFRKRGTVLLNRRVEVDGAALDELHDGRRRDRLRQRRRTESALLVHGEGVFEIAKSEAFHVLEAAVERERHAHAGDLEPDALGLDDLVDLLTRFAGQLRDCLGADERGCCHHRGGDHASRHLSKYNRSAVGHDRCPR